MNRSELPSIPRIEQAVEQVVASAQLAGEYPQIFDESHLPQTVHAVISAAHLPVQTVRQQRHANRLGWYHVGLYTQAHKLD